MINRFLKIESPTQVGPFEYKEHLRPIPLYTALIGLFVDTERFELVDIVHDPEAWGLKEVARVYRNRQNQQLYIIHFPGKDSTQKQTSENHVAPLSARYKFVRDSLSASNKCSQDELQSAKWIYPVAGSNTVTILMAFTTSVMHYIKAELNGDQLTIEDSVDWDYNTETLGKMLPHTNKTITKRGWQNVAIDNWSCGHYVIAAVERTINGEKAPECFAIDASVLKKHNELYAKGRIAIGASVDPQQFASVSLQSKDEDFGMDDETEKSTASTMPITLDDQENDFAVVSDDADHDKVTVNPHGDDFDMNGSVVGEPVSNQKENKIETPVSHVSKQNNRLTSSALFSENARPLRASQDLTKPSNAVVQSFSDSISIMQKYRQRPLWQKALIVGAIGLGVFVTVAALAALVGTVIYFAAPLLPFLAPAVPLIAAAAAPFVAAPVMTTLAIIGGGLISAAAGAITYAATHQNKPANKCDAKSSQQTVFNGGGTYTSLARPLKTSSMTSAPPVIANKKVAAESKKQVPTQSVVNSYPITPVIPMDDSTNRLGC